MQYGTQKSTGPFRLAIQIDAEPRCPGCAEFLQPCVIEFRDGWAWCQPCIVMGLHAEPWIGSVLGSDNMQCRSCVVHGLRFYTPDAAGVPAETAFERYARIPGDKCLSETTDEPDGLYLVTPAGVVPIANCDMTGLRELEEVMKRRHRSEAPEAAIRSDDAFALTADDEQELLDLDVDDDRYLR